MQIRLDSHAKVNRRILTALMFWLIGGVNECQLLAQESLAWTRVLPVSPNEAVETLRIAGPLEVQLVVAEPEVCDPVAADFDEFGTLYVVEMR